MRPSGRAADALRDVSFTTGFARHAEGSSSFLIVLNLTPRPCYFKPAPGPLPVVVEVATDPEREGIRVSDAFNLGGDEGLVVRLD